MGNINNPKAIDVLIHALDTEGMFVKDQKIGDWQVCDAAAEALANMQAPDLNDKLIKLFHSKNYNGRVEAVRLLVRRGWIPPTLKLWIEFDIAAGLFDVIHEKGTPAVEPLIATLEYTDWNYVGGAAKALGKIRDERAIEPLIKVLNSDGWPRQEAAKALKGFGDERAIKPLINTLKSDDWHVRAAVVDTLGVYEQPEVQEALKLAANDSHPRVGEAANRALNK